MKPDPFIPPRLARKILLAFLRDDLAEEVCGDLEESYRASLRNRSAFRAKMNYWYQVLHYVRPFAIRKPRSNALNNLDMLQNYLTIGWRNMSKQKMYSAIKVGGFALGIGACLLIALFIRHEFSYDRHFPKGDRIYRVVEQYNNKGKMERGVHLPAPFGPALLSDYPEVEQVARINPVALFGAGSNNIRRDDQPENTHEEGFVWADQTILQMFDTPFLYGNALSALSEPNSLVMTKRKADKYFPGEDPVGKIMIIGNDESTPYKIGGVIADPPEASHFQYDFLMSLSGKEFGAGEQTRWLQSNYPTYILLRDGADPADLERKLAAIGEKYYLPRLLAIDHPNIREEIRHLSYRLQPVSAIHFNTLEARDSMNHGDIRFTWLSGAVAIFILVIACINFINLSTAKSANRAREVGLRKVVGSCRGSLVKQFLTEAVFYSFFSFALGLVLATALVPFFNTLVGKTLVFPWREWWLLPALGGAALITGILAGIYPSFYLSSFRPIEVLKGNVARGSKGGQMRSMLVVFQFTTSIVLIIGTFIINRQMQYILNTKIGFEKDQVILIQGTDLLGERLVTFKNELLALRDVTAASITDYLPIHGTKRNGNSFDKKETADRESVSAQFWQVDRDYVRTMGMRLAQGRDFSDSAGMDSEAIIINQAMARELGYDDPVGHRINNYKDWTIIGVVEDFNFESLRNQVRPLCLVLGNSPSITSVKVNTADMHAVINSLTGLWKQFAPQQPIRLAFLDETYARMYDDVVRMGKIFTSFALLAITVACLGLFGLSSFMVEQRSKEISIRLVLGASATSIFRLLTGNFVRLILIAFVLAAPIAWYVMDLWLQSYTYKTPMTMDIFVWAGLIAVLIALVTISYQALRAGFANPVTSLKAE